MAKHLNRFGLSRRDMAFGLLVAATGLPAVAAPCSAPVVLFVCPAGTVKSAIAREMLRQSAARAHVPVRVESRGLHIEDHLSSALVTHLCRDGIDPINQAARPFGDADLKAADIVVVFDEAVEAPALRAARAWAVPSWNADYDKAKAASTAYVDALVEELRARQATPCKPASNKVHGAPK